MMDKIKVIIASHIKFQMPPQYKMYVPMHVGAYGNEDFGEGFIRDDTLDNISIKNKNYCELTGLYWAWKNLDCEYLGLVHYRRHFKDHKGKNGFDNILKVSTIEPCLDPNIIYLPDTRHYYIETNESQYIHAHHPIGFYNTRKVIEKLYPDYLEAFDIVNKRTYGHRFNMFIMSKEKSDAYCKWLFDILFEVEKITDISTWDAKEQRIFGYLSERLLDVWIYKNNYVYKDIPYMFLEKQNWFKKGFCFIGRKIKGLFKHEKATESERE